MIRYLCNPFVFPICIFTLASDVIFRIVLSANLTWIHMHVFSLVVSPSRIIDFVAPVFVSVVRWMSSILIIIIASGRFIVAILTVSCQDPIR